ncbi:MAG: hypothetical protein Q9187_000716 [Circinaria calcarea]
MPEDRSDSEQSRDLLTVMRKGKWREKLFHRADHSSKLADKTAKQKLQLNTDIADFLKSPITAVRPPHLDTEAITRKPIPPKPIPPAVSRNGAPGVAQSRPSTSHSSTSLPDSSRRKRRARGLHVSFTNAAPVIIGEGGDEAVVPPCEVAKAWRSAIHLPRSIPNHSFTTPVIPPTDQLQGDERFTRMPIQRVSTGFNRKPEGNLNSETPPIIHEQVAAKDPDPLRELEREKSHNSRHGQPRLDQVKPLQKSEEQRTKLGSGMEPKFNSGPMDELFLPPRHIGHEPELHLGNVQNVTVFPNEQPSAVRLPSTPRHSASDYTDMLSPYPDDASHGSPIRDQENILMDGPPETTNYDDTQAFPDKFSRLGVLRR